MRLVLLYMDQIKKFHIAQMYKVDNPVSLYAATKKSNELIAHAYSNYITFLLLDFVSSQYMVQGT